MAPTRHPLIDLVYNDETGRYIGMLERKLLYFTLNDMKMRALLECLTGDMWDDADFHKMTDDEIKEIAKDTLKRRLQMSEADAVRLVHDRWVANNPEPASEETKKLLIGLPPAKTPHVVVNSRPIGKQPGFDYKKHLAGLAQAKERDKFRDQL